MTTIVRKALGLALCLSIGGLVLTGCGNSGENKATPQEQADFAGKPMPPEVAAELQRRMQQNTAARDRSVQGGAAQATQGPAGGR